ncbi:hypothetical protein ACFLT1_07820 [Bacteroidota bacterium]
MEIYLNQLIDDISELKSGAPPFMARQEGVSLAIDKEDRFEEQMMEFEDHVLNEKGEVISMYTGITRSHLPDAELLTDEQVEILLHSLIDLCEHYQFFIDFPGDIPVRNQYMKVRELWNDFKAPLIDCQLYYDFCSYDEDDCPFPGVCNGCNENDIIQEDTIPSDENINDLSSEEEGNDSRFERLQRRIFSKPGKGYIAGIHNYCDRWCERCPLTDRCVIYDPEEEDGNSSAENILSWSESWEEDRMKDYEKVSRIAKAKMEELNITPYDLAENEGFSIIDREGLQFRAEARELMTISECYSKSVNNWFKSEGLENIKKEISFPEVIETINWYSLMVSTKIFRSLLPESDEFDLDMDNAQSDNNGSAKVAIKSILQSLYAWSWIILNKPKYEKVGITFSILLTGMLEGMQSFFPRAEEFVRPGFDQPEEEWQLS